MNPKSSLLFTLLAAAGMASAVEVRCATHVAAFDESRKGALVALTSKGGTAFLAAKPGGLFNVTARRTDALTNAVSANVTHAKTFRCEKLPDGVRLVYSDFGDKPFEEVACTVRGTASDTRLRWRIAVVPKAGWAVCETFYPQLSLATALGGSGDDDAVLTGASFCNGLKRNPLKNGFHVDSRQPGYLAVQMACYFDPKALLLFACEDGAGEAKRLHGWIEKGNHLIQLRWCHLGWNAGRAVLPYDVVTAMRDDPQGGLTWHDGADLYKEWAVKQRWCRTPWKFRTDIPDWLRGQAAYSDMGSRWRGWMDKPGSLVAWARDYFHRNFPEAKVAVHFDGWERNGVYNMTHYFPLYPTDEAYTAFATEARKYGFLAFPWPSGTRRSDAFDQKPDGTFAVDERAAFARDFLPHACTLPNGERHLCRCGWLRGGKVSYMCSGDPWTLDWFAKDICGELARRGTPCVSCDQNIGGAAAECWNAAHGHTPGSGVWMTEAARRMALTSVAALRAKFPEAAFCYEEPNEHVNDTVTFNNVREAYTPAVEWSGLFSYLYHEYAPIFPLGGRGTYGQAYQVAMGFMPVVQVEMGDFDHTSLILPNGGFEETTADGAACVWENGPSQRPNRLDTAEHHAGTHAMRIEHPDDTNKWTHVAMNLAHADSAFRPGRTYRLSAWMKVAKGTVWVDFGVFGEKGGLGWARLQPKPGVTGWQQVTTEFTYPKGAVTMVRLMVNAKRGSLGWLDDVALARVESDGTAAPLRYEGSRARDAWQKRMIEVWGVEGRPWLAYGRRVKPPVLECAEIDYFTRKVQAVCVGAYESMEGEKALVFANGSETEQTAAWTEGGVRRTVTLGPREVKIVRR